MGDTSNDPVDHSRTTRQHAGETMKNGFNAPGLILMAVAILSMVLALASFATGHSSPGLAATAVAAVALFAGGGWLYVAHRQVREQEVRWLAANPEADAQPPAS